MEALFVSEKYSNVDVAFSAVARLGANSKSGALLDQASGDWDVLASEGVRPTLIAIKDLETDLEDFGDPSEDFERDVAEPLLEEFQEDQDGYARSDEDGWYYED